MKKRALVIAPHPDDEINLAGQLLLELNKCDVESFVLYLTNGDVNEKIGNRRIYEAIAACDVLGVNEEHVIFLGYANGWNSRTHIFNSAIDEEKESLLGKRRTNSIAEHPEYCYEKERVHHAFTRRNFKEDMKKVILELMPTLLVSPEFDSHPDHRAASLLFDEIMGEIFRENKEYKPLVLKKYIHEGVWNGKKDYYSFPMIPTLTDGIRMYSGGCHELDSPIFTWGQRASFKTDESTRTKYLRKNILYKAAKKHRVTTAWYEMQRVINADMVYWRRRTDSILRGATISVTSGNAECLRDFILYECEDVEETKEPFLRQKGVVWSPEEWDEKKEIVIKFNEGEDIESIVIYENCNVGHHINRMKITADGRVLYDGGLNEDGTGTTIELGKGHVINELKLSIIDYMGIPGISEIEIFSQKNMDLDYTEYGLTPYKQEENVKARKTIGQYIEQIWLMVMFCFKFKIKYEIKTLLGCKP